MRRQELEEYRVQMVQTIIDLDAFAVRQLAQTQRIGTISVQTSEFEPRERPAKSGALKNN